MSLSEETKQRCREMLLEMRHGLVSEMKARRQANPERDYLGDMCDWTTSAMEAEYIFQ